MLLLSNYYASGYQHQMGWALIPALQRNVLNPLALAQLEICMLNKKKITEVPFV